MYARQLESDERCDAMRCHDGWLLTSVIEGVGPRCVRRRDDSPIEFTGSSILGTSAAGDKMFPKAMVGLGRDYLIQNPDLTHHLSSSC